MSIRGAAPSMSSQRRIAASMAAAQEGATARMNTETGPFPFVAYAPDPYDERFYILRQQLDSGVQPYYQLNEADLEYIRRQRDQMQQLEFDIFTWNLFDMSNPAVRQWVSDHIDNSLYDRMIAYLDASLENTKKQALIRMRGPASKADVEFIYHLQQGVQHVPESYDPLRMDKPMQNTTRGAGGIDTEQLGIFNPLALIRSTGLSRIGYNKANQINSFAAPDSAVPGYRDDTTAANATFDSLGGAFSNVDTNFGNPRNDSPNFFADAIRRGARVRRTAGPLTNAGTAPAAPALGGFGGASGTSTTKTG